MWSRFQMREGWLSLLLLFLMLLTITISLQAADWAPGMALLNGVFLMAFLLGLLFSKSRLSGFLLHPLALLLGASWISYASLGLAAKAPWEDRAAEVILRLLDWQSHLVARTPSPDTLPFVLIMGALLWLIVYGALWDFYRARNIWGVLIPGSITILINTYYARGDIAFLLIGYLIFAFLLVIRTNLLEQEERWRRSDIAFSPDIQFDFMREGTIFAVAVVALAWFMPYFINTTQMSPTLARLGEPWGRAQQEWGRLFSSLNYRGVATSGTWFGRSMSFRGAITRTEQVVMTVEASKGRYWRAVVFDRYTSAGWAVSEQRIIDGPEANLPLPGTAPESGREVVEQTYTILVPAGTLLFAAGQPVDIGLPSQLMLGGPTAGESAPSYDAIAQLYARTPLFQGQTYSVRSAISVADTQSLRAAGTTYPDWLQAHYTALPESVSPRVQELAQQLTAQATNPYDMARTLETYLRSFPYSETISGPNPGEDGVEYFLFREKQGYCDYYASAMAVMLRSLGIPARIAQGYTQGTTLPSGEFEVRQTNAHTWVEAYFPGYGWIEFEPTASEPVIERAFGTGETGEEEDDALPVPSNPNLQNNAGEQEIEPVAPATTPFGPGGLGSWTLDPRLLALPLGVLAALGVVGMVGWVLVQRRWRELGPIERIFDQLGWLGQGLGERPDPTLTPQEYAERLGQQVPAVRPPLRRLAELFSKQRFSPLALAETEEGEARQSWLEARQLLLQKALRRLTNRKEEPTGKE